MNMDNTTYKSTEDVINYPEEIKGKTKLKIFKNISLYYNNMNIKVVEDPFARNAQGLSKIDHEVLLLMKFLQTKSQVKNMNINQFDLYYTVIKYGDENDNVDHKNENNENVYFDFNEIVPNHNIGRINNIEILR